MVEETLEITGLNKIVRCYPTAAEAALGLEACGSRIHKAY